MLVINFAAKRSFAAKKLGINLVFVLLALMLFLPQAKLFCHVFRYIYNSINLAFVAENGFAKIIYGGLDIWFSLLTAVVTAYLWLIGTFFNEDLVDYMQWVQYSFLAYSKNLAQIDIISNGKTFDFC